jgi:hypothetical protein
MKSVSSLAVAGTVVVSGALVIGLVAGPSGAASMQHLTIAVTGLPAGATETITVLGGGDKTSVDVQGTGQPTSVKVRVAAGNYTVEARDATLGRQRYFPSAYLSTLRVPSGQQVDLHFRELVLTFSGLEKLRLGMTVARARAADPSLRVQGTAGCVSAHSRDAYLLFNPDGRLSYVSAAPYVATAKGITKGSTYAQVAAAYTITNPVLTTDDDQPMWIGANGRQDDPGPAAEIGLRFRGGQDQGTNEVDVSQGGIVSQLVLDGGQRCFD